MQTPPSPNDGASVPSTAANVAVRFVAQEISPKFPSRSDTELYSRCEVAQTLRGGRCELPGEIEFGGALLCARHAREAEIYERIDLLLGIVLSSDLCLRTVSLRRNRNRTLLLRCQRASATRELDLAYRDLRRLENDEP